ncbi:hypothetical protein PMAYCL1PPCAC_30332, partial [Pristionchus mayeri]
YLGLHLEACVGEGLLEGNTTHETRLLEGSARDALHADHVERESLVEDVHCVDAHVGEVLALSRHLLGAERRHCALHKHVPECSIALDLHCQRIQVADGLYQLVINARMSSWGWTPSSMKGFDLLSNSAASTTTTMVPSPTSASCD